MRATVLALRGLIGLSFGLAVLASSPLAEAKGKKADSSAKKAPEKKKVLVGSFVGPKSEQARKAVIAALTSDGEYDVSDSSSVKPDADDAAVAEASGGATVVLVGTVKKGTGLVLSVRNGADGALIQDVEIKGEPGAKLNKSIDATLTVSVADAISQAKPASEGSSSKSDRKKSHADDAGEPSDKDKDEHASDASQDSAEKEPEPVASEGPSPSPLEVTAGLRAVHRNFDYHDTLAQLFPGTGQRSLLSYSLPLGPAIFFDATVYPLAFGSKGAASAFGVTGGYEGNFATKSVVSATQEKLTTQASQFYVGLRGRLPIGVNELGLVVAYGQQTFTLVGDEAAPLVPDVAYKFVRLGADARLHFDAVTLGFHLGTRLVSDVGPLRTVWFPNTKTQSLEAGLLLGYRLAPPLDLVAGLDLTRYAFSFHPTPGAKNVAGGAVDQYISGWLGVRFTLAGHAE